MSSRLVLCFGVALMLAGVAAADVPQLINYQGVLLDTAGDPVTTSVNVVFAIWNAETDGDSVWSEPRIVTPDNTGAFGIMLGEAAPIAAGIFAEPNRWLAVQVEGDPEMQPRTRLSSVGYAFRVGSLDGAHGGVVRDSLLIPDPDGDTVVITSGDIVIRGAGGDNTVVCQSTGMTVTDPSDDLRIQIAIDENGPAITLYESLAAAQKAGRETGSAKLEFREGGVLLFGSSEADTVCHLWPNGNIFGKGQLAMGENHVASGTWSNVAGYNNDASGDSSVICGGYDNIATGRAAVVVGGSYNTAGGISAAVGGGHGNNASVNFATIPGGHQNTASGGMSTVGGGWLNNASNACATVGGGRYNNAGNEDATVSGGRANSASGWGATIPGGAINKAYGAYSFAAGYRARAEHDGAFVWCDSTDADLSSTAPNQFRARASGGVRFYTSANLSTGVAVPPGGGAWSSISDREVKRNIHPVDGEELLEKLAQLEVSRWSYKTQDERIEHIGPMAQDFYRLFEVGDNNTTISTIDPDGIALAAIKELYQQNQDLKKQVEELEVLVQKLLKDEE